MSVSYKFMKKYLFFVILFVGSFVFLSNDVSAAIECSDFSGSEPSLHQIPCEKIGCFFDKNEGNKCQTQRENFCGNLNGNECKTTGVAATCCEWDDDVPFPFMARCIARTSAPACIYPNGPVAPTGACTSITYVTLCLLRSDCVWDFAAAPTYAVEGPYCSSKYPAPSISKEADLSGVSFNNPVVSGIFKDGIQKINNVCSSFIFTDVKYKIDNGAEKTLSCWKSIGPVSCVSDIEASKPIARAEGIFSKILNIFKSPIQILANLDEEGDGGGGGDGNSCSTCQVNQYQFNSNCSINTTGLSAGSHTLTLIFKTNSSVKSSYTKTFTIGSTSECLSSENNPSGSNDDCIAKYGFGSGKICCHTNVCSKCGGGPGPTSTPTPTPTPTPNPPILILELSQTFSTQNITTGSKAGAKISANPGDLIKLSAIIKSTGKNEVKNTLVKASLPNKLIFQDGSITVDGQKMSGDFFGRGLDIGTLAAGQSKTVTFDAMVATQSQFAANSQELLISSIVVQGVGVAAKTSSVGVTIGVGKIISEMSLDMNARNITKGTSLTRNLEANPGDTVEFRLVAIATGVGTVSEAKMSDVLPKAFQYIPGSTKIDGSFAADGIIGKGVSLGNLERNNSRVVVFSAKVSESYDYNIGENYFQNVGKISASNVSASTDFIDVKVVREAISEGKLSVGARLVTNSQFFYARSITASPGQQVEFAVKITGIGEGDLNNVVLKNVFPSRLTYVKGSTSIDNQKVDDSIITGLNVGNIALGSYKIITFHGLVSGATSFNYGQTPLVNEISMTATGVDPTIREVTVNVNRYKPQASPTPSLELMAYNETQGQDATIVSAKPGDIVWLVMIATNNYDSNISNYEIKNDISDLLKVSSVYSSGGGAVAEGVLTYPAATIPASSAISKELKIKISDADKWNDILQVSDTFGNTSVINLEKPIVIPEPKIEVVKRIINTTWANGTDVEVEARPNDQLEFVVEVTNTSPIMVGDVKVVENLPAKLTYVSGDESATYNSLTGEVLWELGALIPGEKKELRLLAAVSSDAFIPSEFALTARAEAFNGINSMSLDSNEVTAGIKSFSNPYSLWIKIIGGVAILILLIIFGYILYKRLIKKRDNNEYLPLGKN